MVCSCHRSRGQRGKVNTPTPCSHCSPRSGRSPVHMPWHRTRMCLQRESRAAQGLAGKLQKVKAMSCLTITRIQIPNPLSARSTTAATTATTTSATAQQQPATRLSCCRHRRLLLLPACSASCQRQYARSLVGDGGLSSRSPAAHTVRSRH